jgi:hypothetical protein
MPENRKKKPEKKTQAYQLNELDRLEKEEAAARKAAKEAQ